MTTLVIIAVVATVVAFLLSAGETGLARVSRSRALQLQDDGRKGAGHLVRITTDPGPFLAVATFVRVAAEAVTAVTVTVAVDMVADSHWRTALIAAAIMVVISFVVVGVSPRTLGRQHAEKVALLAAPVVRLLRVFLGPVSSLLILFGNAVTPGRGYAQGPFSSESELRELVDLAGESAVIEEDEREMIHSIFELGDTVAREVMVPRPDLITIKSEKVLQKSMSLFLRSGLSRVPVVGEDTDDVLGMLYFKDVARQTNANPDSAQTMPVTEVMRPVTRVPEMKRVDDLLKEMQQARQHVAIVIDEYGGTAGLITIEDILEEIVGEITDEYDRAEAEIETVSGDQGDDGAAPGGNGHAVGNGTVLRVPANLPLDDLAELFDVELENEDVDSVGGLLASLLGMVPIAGSSATTAGLELTAERMAGRRRRVATVLVRRAEPEGEHPDGEAERSTDETAQTTTTPSKETSGAR